ncbi:hypothetical protein BH10CYA1_BH10CYA1_34120 [soil metagenome]
MCDFAGNNSKKMNGTKLAIVGLAFLLLGRAEAAAELVDSAKMIYVLRNTKAIRPEAPLNAALIQKQAIILTSRSAKASDKDCKIDAVLIAKELLNVFPDQISRVRILFSKPNTHLSSQVDVTAGDVKAFAVGAMNVESLLSSLEVVDVDSGSTGTAGQSALTIVPGALADKRLMLLSRIEALRSKGTSVKPFMDIFSRIEGEVASSSSELLTKDVAYLADKLGEQEKLLKQATASRGGPRTGSGSGSGSGGPTHTGMPVFSADAARAEQRCQDWNLKLNQWRSEGRDVAQLIASIAATRMVLADHTPESAQKANAMLDGLDFLFKSGPPAR